MVDIPHIEGELLLPAKHVAAVDLGPAGDAGLYFHTAGLEGAVARHIAHEQRARADDAIIAPATEGGGAGANDPKAIGHAWHRANLEEAIAAILAGKQPAVNGTEGRKAVELILALYQSAQSGGVPVDLPLKQDTVLRKLAQKN
jgi:predicted dehydrogenase